MIKDKVNELFGIDVRALGIFRIGLAVILLIDLIIRATSLTAFYTDSGALPRSFLTTFANPNWISIHALGGSLLFESILFIIAGIFAIMLLLGYKTKVASIASWFLLISLQSRNPIVLQGGDVLLRVLAFWAMFLPLGAAYALDSRKLKKKITSFGTAGILIQIALVYFFSALLKTGNEWTPDGTAIYYALSIDQFATHIGKFLLEFPTVMFYLTNYTYYLELIGPILLFVPIFTKYVRPFAAANFFILLLGMALSMRLAHFPLIGMVGFLLFLPTGFWDWFEKLIHRETNFEEKATKNKLKTILSIAGNALAIFFIAFILLWNIQSLGKVDAVPDSTEFIAHGLRVDQYWNMFSPYPLKDDGWYVLEARTLSGEYIDLMRGGNSLTWDKPKHVASLYVNERWRKYFMNLWQRDNSNHRSYYLSYLCRSWNENHDQQVEHINMVFMLENTLPEYGQVIVEKVSLGERYCLT